MKSRRRGYALRRRILLCAASTVFALVLAEVALRILGISYPQPYAPDEIVGSRLRPGFSGWFTREGAAYVTVNSAGFRDREHAVAKPAGTLRIAVLGDSYAEAVQVPMEKTFWALLEEQLNSDGRNESVEVLNFGISGYGTAQELLLLRNEVLDYEPDIVLLAFLSGNDIRNNSIDLEPVKVRPFYSLLDERLVLDSSFREHPDYLKAQTGLTRFKVGCINRFRILQLANELKNRRASGDNEIEQGLDNAVYTPPTDDSWKKAWKLTERLLLECHSVTQKANAQFVVVSVTNAIQVDPRDEVRAAALADLGVEDFGYCDRRIQEFAKANGFHVVTLGAMMRQQAKVDGVYFHGFSNTKLGTGHWNEAGHAMAAKILRPEIADMLTAKRPR